MKHKTISELERELKKLQDAKLEAQAIQSQIDRDIAAIQKELDNRKKIFEPRVSDHALVRYLERVHNFDFQPYRDEILTDKVKTALMLGATGYKINGVNFVCKDGVLVTVTN